VTTYHEADRPEELIARLESPSDPRPAEELMTLEGLLAMCSYCKRIRDTTAPGRRSSATGSRLGGAVSHGVCEDC